MSTTNAPRDLWHCLDDLAKTPAKRPAGMVDWMHYGYALRYGGTRDFVAGEEELCLLEGNANLLDKELRARCLPLLEARAWTAGFLLLRRLPDLLWEEWSLESRGRYLAGLSKHMRGAAKPDAPNLVSGEGAPVSRKPDLTSEIRQRLSSVVLDAESAAEIGSNAINNNCLDVLTSILAHPSLPDGPVPRVSGYQEQARFETQLNQLSTRLLDVLLEAAVRCQSPEAMRLLLEQGANPNIPCWNLERSFNDWFSALSFTIHELCQTGKNAPIRRMIDLLLDHGADARGLECEGWNNPLMTAMRGQEWDLVDRLLALGAKFEGGTYNTPDDFRKNGPLIPGGHPLICYRQKDLDWVEHSIAPLVPLSAPWQVPLFYKGNAQGGWVNTFLHTVTADERLPLLKKYERKGLPTTLTAPMVVDLVEGGRYLALCHLLSDHPNLPRVMFRVRRRKPDFGVAMRQLWLCQPEPDGSNVLSHFNPQGQEPLQLPDGSRVYAFLDCVAPPNHQHGPITEECFWLEKVSAEYRRRRDCIVTRNVRRIWRMEPVPQNEYQIPALVPLVKEVNGAFFWLGITMGSLSWGQQVPEKWRPALEAWKDSTTWTNITKKFVELVKVQRAANIEQAKPVLSEDELKPYPREFWPFLRRLKDADGTIGMNIESCRSNPGMLDLYTVWEEQNKPDRTFLPDPRLLDWPLWPQVPVELRPYFVIDDLFGKPSITFNARNEYEKEMIHKAVAWHNNLMIRSLEELDL